MSEFLDALEAKLRRGEDVTYEEAANLFAHTAVGQAIIARNRLTRNQLLTMLRARFPDETALSASLRGMLETFDHAGGSLH